MAYEWLVFGVLLIVTNASDIELLDCEPPDVPRWGGYGPYQEFYVPGDSIHYYCDVDTFIGGNYYRRCEDTGDWSGNAPVCDPPSTFSSTAQSSTEDEIGGSERAVDRLRTTCTSTRGGNGQEWSGTFATPGQLIRVMLFLPLGPASFDVILVRPNGEEIVCGSQTVNKDRYEWTIQNCPEPHNTGASGLKIKSLTNAQLKICEIHATVLTSPKCIDPHVRIENGHLRLDRHKADLICDSGYRSSPDTTLQCIREGEWDRKTLYCLENQWELSEKEPELDGGGERPDSEHREENHVRESVASGRNRASSKLRQKSRGRERF